MYFRFIFRNFTIQWHSSLCNTSVVRRCTAVVTRLTYIDMEVVVVQVVLSIQN